MIFVTVHARSRADAALPPAHGSPGLPARIMLALAGAGNNVPSEHAANWFPFQRNKQADIDEKALPRGFSSVQEQSYDRNFYKE